MSKPRAVGGNRKASDRGNVIPWVNASGETIPAHAVIQLRTDVVDGMSQASKPNSGAGLFFVSGPADVASGKWGESKLWTKPLMVLVSEAVSVGDEVGPVSGSWQMQPGGSGFRVIHQAASGVATVVMAGGGSSGSPIIRFEIYDADCESRQAVVRILSRNGTVPGEYEIYGETELNEAGETVLSKFVLVYDKTGCYLNESNRNLFGREGYASYLYGRPRHAYQPWWSWEVTNLCEQQTECEAF